MKGGPKAKLTPREQDSLMEYLVAHGQNFVRYTEWADMNNVIPERRFTEQYVRRWCQLHRPRVQAVARQQKIDIRKNSIMHRGARLSELEATYARLNVLSEDPMPPLDLIKIEEQKRRTLEAIAKERGEWLKAEDNTPDPAAEANKRMREVMEGHLAEQRRIASAKVIE